MILCQHLFVSIGLSGCSNSPKACASISCCRTFDLVSCPPTHLKHSMHWIAKQCIKDIKMTTLFHPTRTYGCSICCALAVEIYADDSSPKQRLVFTKFFLRSIVTLFSSSVCPSLTFKILEFMSVTYKM